MVLFYASFDCCYSKNLFVNSLNIVHLPHPHAHRSPRLLGIGKLLSTSESLDMPMSGSPVRFTTSTTQICAVPTLCSRIKEMKGAGRQVMNFLRHVASGLRYIRLEELVGDWQHYKKALRKEDQVAFEQLMDKTSVLSVQRGTARGRIRWNQYSCRSSWSRRKILKCYVRR